MCVGGGGCEVSSSRRRSGRGIHTHSHSPPLHSHAPQKHTHTHAPPPKHTKINAQMHDSHALVPRVEPAALKARAIRLVVAHVTRCDAGALDAHLPNRPNGEGLMVVLGCWGGGGEGKKSLSILTDGRRLVVVLDEGRGGGKKGGEVCVCVCVWW